MIDNNILVSVILPVYNAQKYLEQAIESILKQTYKNFECIVINDGSSDKSLEIIQKYMKLDNRIVLIDRENRGLVTSLNEGIEKAQGKFIARMDADDVSFPERFEEQVALMESKNIDICGCHYLLMDEYDNINDLNITPLSHKTCSLSLVSKVPFAHPSVMMRKSFLQNNDLKYGQSKYKIAEDLDLWIRMHEKGARFANVNDILFKYRVIENSLSKVNSVGISKDTKSIFNLFLENNKEDLIAILKEIQVPLNSEENELIVRLTYKLVRKKFDFRTLKYLKKIDKKTIVCSVLSEMIQ